MNEDDQLSMGVAAVVVLPMAAMAAGVALAMLLTLEQGKEQHQASGGHMPTAQEACYELEQGRLIKLQDMTFCSR